MNLLIRYANETDTKKIASFINRANLSSVGISETINYFVVGENTRQEIKVTLGIERVNNIGLLRSLVISPELSEEDLLVTFSKAVELAKYNNLTELYVTINNYLLMQLLEVLGFKQVKGINIPDELLTTEYFSTVFKNKSPKFMKLNLIVDNT